jgi:hypothetical protein
MDAKTSFVKVAGDCSHKSAVRDQAIGEGDVFITVLRPQMVCQREVASRLKAYLPNYIVKTTIVSFTPQYRRGENMITLDTRLRKYG